MAGSSKTIASRSSSDSPPEEMVSTLPVSGGGRGKPGKNSFLVGDVRFWTESFSREGSGIGGQVGDPIVPISGRGRGRGVVRGGGRSGNAGGAGRSTGARSSLRIGTPSHSAGGAGKSLDRSSIGGGRSTGAQSSLNIGTPSSRSGGATDRRSLIGGPSHSAGGAAKSLARSSSGGSTSLARSRIGADLQPIGALAGTDRDIRRVRSSNCRRATRSGIVNKWKEIDSVFNGMKRELTVEALEMFLKQQMRNPPTARRSRSRSRGPPTEVVKPPFEAIHFLEVIEGEFDDGTTIQIHTTEGEEMTKDVMVACAVRKLDFELV